MWEPGLCTRQFLSCFLFSSSGEDEGDPLQEACLRGRRHQQEGSHYFPSLALSAEDSYSALLLSPSMFTTKASQHTLHRCARAHTQGKRFRNSWRSRLLCILDVVKEHPKTNSKQNKQKPFRVREMMTLVIFYHGPFPGIFECPQRLLTCIR